MSIFFSTFAAEMCAYTTCILEYDENRCDITYLNVKDNIDNKIDKIRQYKETKLIIIVI